MADPRFAEFLKEHKITEVECLVPDMNGVARGKILPAHKFLRALENRGLRIPEAIFVQTINGEYPADDDVTSDEVGDVYMLPDPETIRLVPWYKDSTAQVICDCVYRDGSPVDISPRHVLRRVLGRFAERGWKPLVAPELEFYLVAPNLDPDLPLVPPAGRSGRVESGRQAYGIDAVNEFDPIFEEVYEFCEAQGIDIDTLSHESGAAQIEINFEHGDALHLADQVILFKRTVREAAARHKVYATFMAKPHQAEAGSAMHFHQSLVDIASGNNIFGAEDGSDTQLFMQYIGGLQKYMPAAMALLAPNVNSYRRLVQGTDAPINAHWGRDNRTTGFRVPMSEPQARRVENRVAGADTNPYLAIAGGLACGFLGMDQELEPNDPVSGSAHRLAHSLPRHLTDALNRLGSNRALKGILGDRFIEAFLCVKRDEFNNHHKVISAWEREFLLLNV